MAVAKLNYTGRRRINRKNIRIIPSDNSFLLDGTDLKDACPEVAGDALVFVEPYRQFGAQRLHIPYGTVAKLVAPPEQQRNLESFGSMDGVMFRVLVVNNQEEGKILALGDQIRPEGYHDGEQGGQSILDVVPRDLGDECWQVSYANDTPVFLINKTMGNWRHIASSDEFRAFVYPAVLREILSRILSGGDIVNLEEKTPFAIWLNFGKSFAGEPPQGGGAREINDWIDDVVGAFCTKHRTATKGREIFNARKQ